MYLTPTPERGGIPVMAEPVPVTVPATLPTTSQPLPDTPTPTQLPTGTPTVTPLQSTPTIDTTLIPTSDIPPILYYTQSGDTLSAVAARFGVETNQITSAVTLPLTGLIDPGTLLVIPDVLGEVGPNTQILPDSEFVFSVTAADFDIYAYIAEAGGELSKYREYLGSAGWTTGAQAIERIAVENSINPRLLLAILDYEGNWVTGRPRDYRHTQYPMGFEKRFEQGVFRQMVLAVNHLHTGYYGSIRTSVSRRCTRRSSAIPGCALRTLARSSRTA
jgi:hypothetical protein